MNAEEQDQLVLQLKEYGRLYGLQVEWAKLIGVLKGDNDDIHEYNQRVQRATQSVREFLPPSNLLLEQLPTAQAEIERYLAAANLAIADDTASGTRDHTARLTQGMEQVKAAMEQAKTVAEQDPAVQKYRNDGMAANSGKVQSHNPSGSLGVSVQGIDVRAIKATENAIPPVTFPSSPSKKRRKTRVSADIRHDLIVSLLEQHHNVGENGQARNPEPLGNSEIHERLEGQIAAGSITNWMKRYFGETGQLGYEAACKNGSFGLKFLTIKGEYYHRGRNDGGDGGDE